MLHGNGACADQRRQLPAGLRPGQRLQVLPLLAGRQQADKKRRLRRVDLAHGARLAGRHLPDERHFFLVEALEQAADRLQRVQSEVIFCKKCFYSFCILF